MSTDMRIGILGYAREGQDTESYLLSHGYNNVTVIDNNPDTMSLRGNPVITGPDALNNLSDFDVLFRTPGIQIRSPELRRAQEQGVMITSQVEYFLHHTDAITVGITGTKGKSTTSTLIYEFLKEAGKEAYLVGNIGKSMLSLLDTITSESIVVMELSSFQLQDISVSPHVAVLLGMSPEHLDYHADMEEYVEAKSSITIHQEREDILIYNKDNSYSNTIAQSTAARTLAVSTQVDAAQGYVGDTVLHIAHPSASFDIPYTDIVLVGVHQRQNILPAILAALELGVDKKYIQTVLKRFTGLPYRMECVGTYAGITFYNDSLATTPEATVAAVRSMNQNTILLLGGGDKGVDFDEMVQELVHEKSLRYIVLIGHDSADRISECLAKLGSSRLVWGEDPQGEEISVLHISSYEELEATLQRIVKPEMSVLLSPACTSFDFFKDYKERGDYFTEVARRFG